jgi:hypothetical protein
VDDDGDLEDAAGMEYAWFVSNPDTGDLVQVGTGRTYVVRPADQGTYQSVVFSVEKAKSLTGAPNEQLRPTSPAGQWQRTRTGLVISGRLPVATNLAIDGVAQVGQVLTGRYDYSDPEDDPEVDSSLRWFRAIDATGHIPSMREEVGQGTTYTVQPGDVGYHLVFQVVPKTSASRPPSIGIDKRVATAMPVPGTAPTATALRLSGPPVAGQTVTVDYDYADAEGDAEGGTTFQWYWHKPGVYITPIAGATAKSHTVRAADVGAHRLLVEVTPRSATGTPDTGATVEVQSAVDISGVGPKATNLTVTGSMVVGQTLTGMYIFEDLENDPEGASTFKWYRADNAEGTIGKTLIAGATAATYTLVGVDQGKYNVFEVTPVSLTGAPDTGAPASQVSATTIVGRAPYVANMRITGRPTVGSTVTFEYDYTDQDGDQEGATEFDWCRSDGTCGLSSARTYVITAEDVGHTLGGRITPKATTGTPDTGNTASVEDFPETGTIRFESAPTATGLTLSEAPVAGRTVTVNYDYDDAEGDVEGDTLYQWYLHRPGFYITPIPGATAKSYTVQAADQGPRRLLVEVTPKSATGTPDTGEKVQVQSDANILGRPPTMTAPTISGVRGVGSTLTGIPNGYADLDGDASGMHDYRWYVTDDATGTTNRTQREAYSNTYTMGSADQGKYVVFEVWPVSNTGMPFKGAPVSSVTTTVVIGTHPTVNSLAITGTYKVGQTLTGSYNYVDNDNDPEDTSVGGTTYQWYVSDPATGDPVAVAGATGRTYVIRPEDQGANRRIWFNVEIVRSTTGVPKERIGPWGTSRAGLVESNNSAPVASNLTIEGVVPLDRGQTYEATWSYSDEENDAPGAHAYQWFVADNAEGTINKQAIAGATGKTYVLAPEYAGKFLGFTVTPHDIGGAAGSSASLFSTSSARYRESGSFKVLYRTKRLIPIIVSNRSGNAPANLRLSVWRTFYGYLAGVTDRPPVCVLIAPDNSRFPATCPMPGSAASTTIDASAVPANGTWQLETSWTDTESAYVDNKEMAEFAHVTLEFNP